MFSKINDWLNTRFSKPEVGVLVCVVIIGIIIIAFFSEMFAPILAGLVFSFFIRIGS